MMEKRQQGVRFLFEQFAMRPIDLALVLEIYDELKEIDGDLASDMLLSSSFLREMKRDPEYVQCQGVEFWIEQIRTEWKGKESREDKTKNKR